MKRTNQRVERFLHERGFTNPGIRQLVRYQLYLATGSSLGLMLATLFSAWSWAYAAGAVVITANFWFLTRAAQNLMFVRKGAVTSLLLLFYGKMILTALALYALVALVEVPVSGLLAGLSSVVLSAVIWGAMNLRQREKEA